MAAIRRLLSACLLTLAGAHATLAVAQTTSPAVPPPGAVQSAPLAPPPAASPGAPGVIAPGTGMAQSPPPAASSPASPPAATITQTPLPGSTPASPAPTATAGARSTLVPEAGDTSNVDEVVLPEKTAVILSGTSTWEEGFKTLKSAFARIDSELAKAALPPAGRPLAVFTQTTDDNFKFDALVPIARPAGGNPTLPPDFRVGTTPSGKAYRFVHKGPYDNIDSTYETITAYLDVKDVVANDAFIEEYVTDVADAGDPALEINIFVQPK